MVPSSAQYPGCASFVFFEIERELDRHLPEVRFPELRARRLTYPHLRKLTDIHCWRQGWTLVLDSDMLFFREPRFLFDWLAGPSQACHMLDVFPAYGYSTHLMQELCGHPIPSLVNVGLCGLRSDAIDWDMLERWCKELVAREGMSPFLEQAMIAMLFAEKPRAEASMSDYRVLPDLREGREPSAVLHHYVTKSKRAYFQHGWQRVQERGSSQAS